MVVNLCEPHFHTTIQCDKLCADGYDVTNLLSGDPVTRRRGFRLEYFLRPPLHVTLGFPVKMELCRVDVELWPWRTDQGKSSRRLEIFSSSDPPAQVERDVGQFKLVARCDLQDETQVSFLNPSFKPRAPFLDPPPPVPAQAKRQDLWSRGPQSLGSVAQLRVSIPYSGAATALGIKSLSVWALPARCCSPSEVEKFQEAHLNSLQLNRHSSLDPTTVSPKPDHISPDILIPEEFLDPLTQELMVFPMILPSGMVIDNSTLEEYQKREATWGRLPNDPFTGVPFAQNSKPLPNTALKSRIDRLVLQTGCTGVGNKLMNKPQSSRLIVSPNAGEARSSANFSRDHNDSESKEVRCQSVNSVLTSGQTRCRSSKRKYESLTSSSSSVDSAAPHTTESHEQRLADSLDEALNEALHGLPTFTSQRKTNSDPETSAGTSQSDDSTRGNCEGQQKCLFCSCLLSVYSWSVLSYSLSCGHLICGPCLQRKRLADSQRLKIKCPACGVFASSSDITRVHH